MPPFRLEPLPFNPLDRLRKSIYHSKKIYSPGVKVSNWESHQFCQPVDNDPCNVNCPNLHMSHYNQLGWYDDVEWTTTTGGALQQIYSRRKDLEVNPYKTIINLHSEVYDCDNASEVSPYCPVDYEESYLSTTHYSYPPPYPCVLRRVSMPKTPFFLNRKLNSTGGNGKFRDDDYIHQTRDCSDLNNSDKCPTTPAPESILMELLDLSNNSVVFH
nr:unnamed protein product [Callosobruchus analis]